MVMVSWSTETEVRMVAKAKKDCVKVSGRWHSKIEYVMEVLGAKEVTKRLRDFKGKLIDINPKVFNEALDSMLEDCKQQTGEVIETWI